MPLEIAGYPATLVEFETPTARVSLYTVSNLEEIVDRNALLQAEHLPDPPYWAHLWIGARALARVLAASVDLRGKRVLDLGCGLGLTGLVAGGLGAEVWFADREQAALEFVRASAVKNAIERFEIVKADFLRDSIDAEFDVLLGAEIVYDPLAYRPLADFVDRHLRPGGSFYVTDAFRADAEVFFDELRRRGFSGERRAVTEWEDGRPFGIFIWSFRR